MAVQHSAIVDAQLHPPKGASTASVNETIHSDGAGGVTWEKVGPVHLNGITGNGSIGMHVDSNGDGTFDINYLPHGSVYFNNYAAPYVQAYAAAYAKIGATTIASGSPIEVTESTTNRLTYTGPTRPHFKVSWAASIDQATGASRDISIAVYQNGAKVANSEAHCTTTSALKVSLSGYCDVDLTLNDYLELWIFNRGGGGNMNIYSMSLLVEEL